MRFNKNNPLLDTLEPPCMNCQHRTNTGTLYPEFNGWNCKAFTAEPIPFSILARKFTHREPFAFDFQEGDYVYTPTVYQDDSEPPIDVVFTWDGVLVELENYKPL